MNVLYAFVINNSDMSDKPVTSKDDEGNRRIQLKAWIDKHFGGKQSDFIKAIRGNQGEISALLRGARTFGERKARSIEDVAGMPQRYLEQRDHHSENSASTQNNLLNIVPSDQTKQSGNATNVFVKASNIAPINIKSLGRPVPLITFAQAANWNTIPYPYGPDIAEAWFPCPIAHGPRTYCIEVVSDSMSNPGSKPSYDPGDIIFIDPDKMPVSGDRVAVILENEAEATFRQYIEDGGKKYLKALNPKWDQTYVEIKGKTTICGVVLAKLVIG